MAQEKLPISLLPKEKLLKILKPQRLAFLGHFILSGIIFIIGLILLGYLWWLGILVTFFGIIGIIAVIFYSQAFTYYLTNKRIVIYRKFITISSRQIQYDDISDVVVDQGIIGRIFGFGNVIPITKSGLGTGIVGWQAGGGRVGPSGTIVVGGPVGGQVVPVASPSTCVYGVKDPFAVKNIIFKYKEEYAEAPYLKRIAKSLEKQPKASGMSYCPFCGAGISVKEAKFCPNCGKKLE